MHRVLLIESNPEHARLVIEQLRSSLNEVHFDFSGTYSRTLRLLEKYPYDCIATDISVPDYQGKSMIGSLRNLYPKIPVVVITGQSSPQTLLNVYRDGAVECILKTRDSLNSLASIVRKIILKNQWQIHPLSRPAEVIGKMLSGVEKTVSKRMKKITKGARRIIRRRGR